MQSLIWSSNSMALLCPLLRMTYQTLHFARGRHEPVWRIISTILYLRSQRWISRLRITPQIYNIFQYFLKAHLK